MRELAAYLFLVSLFCSGLITPIAIRLGHRWKVLDLPGPRKVHLGSIPLSGGWAIFLALTIVLWGHLLVALAIRGTTLDLYVGDRLQYYIGLAPKLILKVTPLYAGAAAIFVVGLFDDLKGMSVRSRLAFQVVIAMILSACGFRPSLEFLPAWIAAAVGVLWIVGITNAFNLLDGLDGLSAGVAMVGTVALLTIMGITNQPDVVFILAAMSGILLGFLRFNFHPAKVFLGSSGSLLIGYLLAMLTLQVTYMNPGGGGSWLMPLLTPIFILAIPLYDTTSVVLIRLLQKRSVAIGDQSHFHHRLMKLGFSHLQTVLFIVLIAFSVALSAVRLVNASMFGSILILMQIMGILSLLVLAERVAAKVLRELVERRLKSEENHPVHPEDAPETQHHA